MILEKGLTTKFSRFPSIIRKLTRKYFFFFKKNLINFFLKASCRRFHFILIFRNVLYWEILEIFPNQAMIHLFFNSLHQAIKITKKIIFGSGINFTFVGSNDGLQKTKQKRWKNCAFIYFC